ncbi:MAG: ABC transporter substrate-binding protein [bacterium]|nr:ABC transporter substrate-binding protein [bacterium]
MRKVLKIILSVFILLTLLSSIVPISLAQTKLIPGGQYNLSEYQRLTGTKIVKFSESPILVELVKQGKIPPVEKRLPDEPVVSIPFEEIGQYGGTLKGEAHLGVSDKTGWWRMVHEPLVYWDKDCKKIHPNIARAWKISDNGKTFTFYIRKGLKWSDGQPFTVDDIIFYYEDILLNKELTPTFPTWLTTKGKPVNVEKVDDYTVRFKFQEPYGYFIARVAEGNDLYAPKHYLKQFHPKYTDSKKLEELAKKEGFAYWYQLFAQKNDWALNTELPEMSAWKTTTPFTSNFHIAERNPYYFKIDPSGNQLPYIDRVRRELLSSSQLIIMKILSGDIDFQLRHVWNMYDNYPLFMENREKGSYRIIKFIGSQTSTGAIYINQNVQDPVLRSLFQNKMFRRALSLGINRDEINQLVLSGLGEGRLGLLSPLHKAYVESVDKAYIEYDPVKANKILDSLGLNKRDKDGYRLRPDGKPLMVTIYVHANLITTIDMMKLVTDYWKKLGIKAEVKPETNVLVGAKVQANEFEMQGFTISVGADGYSGDLSPNNNWCPLWYRWLNTGGKSGEEPPKEIKRLWQIFQDEFYSTTSEAKRVALLKEAMRLHSQNLWIIGTVGVTWMMAIAKNDLRNVPESGFTWHPAAPGVFRAEQWFFKTK